MNILFITAAPIELNSSSMIRNINFIEGLTENDNEVTVLCEEVNNNAKNRQHIKFDNIDIIRIGKQNMLLRANEKSKNNGSITSFLLKRIIGLYRRFSFLKSHGQILKYCKDVDFNNKHFDIVITSSDPKASHMLFKKIKNKVNFNKWYQYWGDPLAEDITDNTIYPYVIKKLYEKQILKLADKIIYVTPLTLELQRKVFPKLAHKMMFLPVPSGKGVQYKKKENDKIVLSFAGGYYTRARNIMPLYNAVKNSPDVELIIAGESDVCLESTNNIKILKKIDRNMVKEIEEQSDVLVSISNIKGTQIPSKANYCASTNKSILVILDGDVENIKKYLSKFNRFEFCYNNVESIKEFIEKYKNEPIQVKENRDKPCIELSAKYITRNIK